MSYQRRAIQSVDVQVNEQSGGILVDVGEAANLALVEVARGETVIGDTSAGNATQITATDTPCHVVILSAPSSSDANGLNTFPLFAVVSSSAVAHADAVAGGTYIGIANHEGMPVYAANANQVRVAGLTAGDTVRWIVLRRATA